MNKDYLYDLYAEFRNNTSITSPDISIVNENRYSEYWAQVRSNEILSSSYILHVNPDLYLQNEDFVKMVAWHEFTHISDGILFSSLMTEKDFITLMLSYSEFHATYKATLFLLENNRYNPPKLPNPEIMSIDNYSKILSYDYSETIWKVYTRTARKADYLCKEMYYFFGYTKAIHDFDRSYGTSLLFYRLPSKYIDTVKRLYVALTRKFIDYNNIIECVNDFNTMIVNVHA